MNIFQKLKWKSLKKKLANLYQLRQHNTVSDADIQKEIALHFKLAEFYTKHLYDTGVPQAAIFLVESYRAAANLGSAKAQYLLSELLFTRGRLWEQIGQGMYGDKIHKKYAKDTYDEAFAYLQAAEEQGHPLAKRLHGLAYVNGWGVAVDREKGFQLVVKSIEQEGAWDRATKIFEETGLNKPEFFESIMSLKQKSQQK